MSGWSLSVSFSLVLFLPTFFFFAESKPLKHFFVLFCSSFSYPFLMSTPTGLRWVAWVFFFFFFFSKGKWLVLGNGSPQERVTAVEEKKSFAAKRWQLLWIPPLLSPEGCLPLLLIRLCFVPFDETSRYKISYEERYDDGILRHELTRFHKFFLEACSSFHAAHENASLLRYIGILNIVLRRNVFPSSCSCEFRS